MVGPANSPLPNGNYGVATGVSSSGPFITVFSTRNPTSSDLNYPVKQRWLNTTNASEWILIGFETNSGVTTANWLLLSDGSPEINIISQNVAGSYDYSPSDGMVYCVVEVIGGGGGGGGALSVGITQCAGAGGGSGAYAKGFFSSSDIGDSQPYIVGAAGAAGSNAGGNGGPGGDSSFGGTLLVGGGGIGGTGQPTDTAIGITIGGAGGTDGGTSVSVSNRGWQGLNGIWVNNAGSLFVQSGAGANSIYGAGGTSLGTTGSFSSSGFNGINGGGGSGAFVSGSAGGLAGGAGGSGIVIITEYIFN